MAAMTPGEAKLVIFDTITEVLLDLLGEDIDADADANFADDDVRESVETLALAILEALDLKVTKVTDDSIVATISL